MPISGSSVSKKQNQQAREVEKNCGKENVEVFIFNHFLRINNAQIFILLIFIFSTVLNPATFCPRFGSNFYKFGKKALTH